MVNQTTTFSVFSVLDYQEIFTMLDNDSDGLISVPDLRIALKSIGMTTSKREVFNMIRQGDANSKLSHYRYIPTSALPPHWRIEYFL